MGFRVQGLGFRVSGVTLCPDAEARTCQTLNLKLELEALAKPYLGPREPRYGLGSQGLGLRAFRAWGFVFRG